MTIVPLTPSQTVGPFFHGALLRDDAVRHQLVSPHDEGEHIRIEGHVLDGNREPVPDAMVEIWQANRHGRYHHPAEDGRALIDPAFIGFGRSGTDERGTFWFETVRPGRVAYDETRLQAPHISFAIFARGLLNHLYTRMYFAEDVANAVDPVLQRVSQARRSTLMAHRSSDDDRSVYQFDIILQGDGETVFFDFVGGSAVSGARAGG